MSFVKTYEEWKFGDANNEDLPAENVDKFARHNPIKVHPEAEKTLIFTPEDEEGYPYKIDERTHGLESHAIKHLYEFKPKIFSDYIEKSRDILMPYIDEQMKILDNRGYIIDDVTEYEDIEEMNPYYIINALDFINDKTYNNEELTEVEEKLIKLVISPITDEYWRLINFIFKNAIRVQDYRKDMGNKPVYYPVSWKAGNQMLNYYDPNTKGLMGITTDKLRVNTLFKITNNTIYEYYKNLKEGSKKPTPNSEILGFLRTYGK